MWFKSFERCLLHLANKFMWNTSFWMMPLECHSPVPCREHLAGHHLTHPSGSALALFLEDPAVTGAALLSEATALSFAHHNGVLVVWAWSSPPEALWGQAPCLRFPRASSALTWYPVHNSCTVNIKERNLLTNIHVTFTWHLCGLLLQSNTT